MPRTPLPEPDRDADPEAIERWLERERRNRNARLNRRRYRDRLAYPADGTPLVAEASCEGTFFRPPPLPPSVLRVSVRLLSPSLFPYDGAIHFEWTASLEGLLLSWKVRDWLWHRLSGTFSAGLHSVPHPWPSGGFVLELTRLDIVPPLEASSSLEEIGRFADALVETIQGALRIAFGGMVAYNLRPRYVETPSLEPEWYIDVPDKFGAGVNMRSRSFASREEAEAALSDIDRAAGARIMLVRDAVSHADLSRGEPPDEEVRYGEGTLALDEAEALTLDEWVFHLGLKRLRRVRGVKLDAPSGPLINAGRG